MNKSRRSKIRSCISELSSLENNVNEIFFEEQESLNRVPENLQNTERYEKIESCVDNLSDILCSLRECEHYLYELLN